MGHGRVLVPYSFEQRIGLTFAVVCGLSEVLPPVLIHNLPSFAPFPPCISGFIRCLWVRLGWPGSAIRWHERGIYTSPGKSYLVREQFWGRAVRASRNSKEFGALLNLGVSTCFSPHPLHPPATVYYFCSQPVAGSEQLGQRPSIRRAVVLLPHPRRRFHCLRGQRFGRAANPKLGRVVCGLWRLVFCDLCACLFFS